MASGSEQYKYVNAARGRDGTSNWTKADFEANFGPSPASSRRKSTPTRSSRSQSDIPF